MLSSYFLLLGAYLADCVGEFARVVMYILGGLVAWCLVVFVRYLVKGGFRGRGRGRR